jgi:chromosome segregation ATPase
MSLTSLLDSITRRQRERKKSNWSDYRQLVADICDGKEPDADRIASVLADNHRTLDELRSDAKLLDKRRKLRAEMDAIQPLRDEVAKVDSRIKKGEKEFEALSEKHKAEMSPLYARRFEISQIRKRSDRAREELRDTCEDRELLEEYEAVQSELSAADVERGRIQKEIGQLRVWADGDKHEASVTAFHSEATRYEQQAETYQERITEFEAKFEPLDRTVAELTDRMASLEQRLLEP